MLERRRITIFALAAQSRPPFPERRYRTDDGTRSLQSTRKPKRLQPRVRVDQHPTPGVVPDLLHDRAGGDVRDETHAPEVVLHEPVRRGSA